MNWKHLLIPIDDEDDPEFEGYLELTNDKNELLAEICWFYTNGPFYVWAMDATNTLLIKRIGPCSTLEGAKQTAMDAMEGKIK